MRLGGPQNRYGRSGEGENLLPLPKMNLGFSSREFERVKVNDTFHLEDAAGR
jgi:hypothetical protein